MIYVSSGGDQNDTKTRTNERSETQRRRMFSLLQHQHLKSSSFKVKNVKCAKEEEFPLQSDVHQSNNQGRLENLVESESRTENYDLEQSEVDTIPKAFGEVDSTNKTSCPGVEECV